MTTIAALFLLSTLHGPAPTMEEVPSYANRQIATLPRKAGAIDVLVVRTYPTLEVGRWSPLSGESVWARTVPAQLRTSCAAVCSIADVNGDGQDDWALVHVPMDESYAAASCIVTIGCGATGATIRSETMEPVGLSVSVCHVRASRNGCDLVVGCPDSANGAGEVLWLRSSDLSIRGRMCAPDGARAFGGFVDCPIAGDPAVWISAPRSPGRWTIWSAATSAVSSRSVVVQGKRPGDQSHWAGDPSRKYGCWVSVSQSPVPRLDRTISIGAAGYPAVGRVASSNWVDWDAAKWIDGPEVLFGSHFGEVVLVVEDLDGDSKPDTIVTAPSLHLGLRDDQLFVGGLFLLPSSEREPCLLAAGEAMMDFLGLGLVPVGDMDGDGFGEVAALALPRSRKKDAYIEVWSVKKRSKLRTIRIPQSESR